MSILASFSENDLLMCSHHHFSGNLFVIAGTTLNVIALTWAGAKHPWSSYQVLLPLILGLFLIAGFFVYEAKVAVEPVVPWELVNNRTSFFGYATTFLHGIVATCIICKPLYAILYPPNLTH